MAQSSVRAGFGQGRRVESDVEGVPAIEPLGSTVAAESQMRPVAHPPRNRTEFFSEARVWRRQKTNLLADARFVSLAVARDRARG